MEPRKEVLKKESERREEVRKSRFQIVKLEDRIAPCSPRGAGGEAWHSGNCRR